MGGGGLDEELKVRGKGRRGGVKKRRGEEGVEKGKRSVEKRDRGGRKILSHGDHA